MLFWKKKDKKTIKKQLQKNTNPSVTIPRPKPIESSSEPDEKKTHIKKSPPRKKTLLKQEKPEKEFLKTFRQLCHHQTTWEVWKDFIVMLACAISNSLDKSHYDEREELYLKTINKYSKQEQLLFPELTAHTIMALEYNPEQDFLGRMFMELNLGDDYKRQIFTPYSVCQCMAEVTLGDVVSKIKEEGYMSINDPCCGAGATLIAAINEAKKQLGKVKLNYQNHILVCGQDIESTVALMCYIQISLLGVAGYIKIADTITEPISDCDSLENYWFTPMYFSDIWITRKTFHKLGAFVGKEKTKDEKKIFNTERAM